MMNILKNIFLIPILPYHLVLFIWVNIVSFRDNNLLDLAMSGEVKKNQTFDNFCRNVDDKILPIKYAISTFVWLHLFIK